MRIPKTDAAFEPTKIARDVDWSKCDAVQSIPGRLGGAWIVKGTRIPVSALIQNYNAGYTIQQLSDELYEGLPADLAHTIILYATKER